MNGRAKALRDLVAGQRVRHGKFGAGTVLKVEYVEGHERAWIDFGALGRRHLAVAVARLSDPDQPAGLLPAAGWEELVDDASPLPPLGREPWAAWFGLAVADDDAALSRMLSGLGDAAPVYPVGGFGGAPCDWPEVTPLMVAAGSARREREMACIMVLHAPSASRPWVVLPFYNDWDHTHLVVPRRIRACAARVEVMVEADLAVGSELLPIAFSLPTFWLCRSLLDGASRVSVALTALAFQCEPAPPQTVRVRHEPDMLEALRRHEVELPVDDDGLVAYRLDGMSAWLASGDREDIVEFRGRVLGVQRIVLPPGQRAAWKLSLRAWRSEQADWALDVVFDASVWPSAQAPTAGTDVLGRAWLQGECLGLVPVPVPRKPGPRRR